jgi:Ca2+-binding EF-hand superfamily protein
MKYLKITLALFAFLTFSQTYSQEIGENVKKRFAKADANSDNTISLEELTAFFEGKKTKKGEPFKVNKMFSKKDTNEDGKLSLVEFAAKGKKNG